MNVEFITPHHLRWFEILQECKHDIYHLPGYLMLEGERINAIPEGIVITEAECTFFIPYLIRSCESMDAFDIVSPYGYPGFLLNSAAQLKPKFLQEAVQILKQSLQERGICSAFFRLHPILNANVLDILREDGLVDSGETVSVNLSLSAEEIWKHTSSHHRNKINRCHRFGLKAMMVPCDTNMKLFSDIYFETMERVGAKHQYYEFNEDYFLKLSNVLGDKLHLCVVEADGEITAAGLYTEWNGIVQAIFGGTRTAFMKQSPTNLETEFVRFWAKERHNQFLHLGGGVGASKDKLYEFKAGFSQLRHTFVTWRLITDEDIYQSLVTQRAKAYNLSPATLRQSSYFPAYRAV